MVAASTGRQRIRLLVEQPINRLLEGWQIAVDNREHPHDVDPEVLVGDEITQARDVCPRDLGRRCSRLGGQVFDRLADNYELKEERVMQKRVSRATAVGRGARG